MRGAIFLILALSLWSCERKTELEEQDLYKFVREESHGLIMIKEEDGFQLAMIWKPNDLIAKQQVIKGTKQEFDSLKNYFSKYLYFTLEMTRQGKDLETSFASDPGSFAEKVTYLSSGLSQNIRLITPRDTVLAIECIYSRSYC